MAIDYSKAKNKNLRFDGTDGVVVPSGTTAERVITEVGKLRYNTDLGFLEQYNATGWAGIDAPPVVTNQTGTLYEDTDATITITGSNFKNGSAVYVTGPGVSNVERALSTTFVSSSELTAASNAASVAYIGGASYGIKVVNPSGLSSFLDPAGTVNREPVWSTGAGSLGTIYDTARSGYSTQVVATDADGDSVTYALQSGSLPNGTTLNTSNGTISGNISAVGSNTTYTFTIRATAAGISTDRTFSITVNAPVASTFSAQIGTYSPQTWTKPSGVTSFTVYMWGAGGGTGANNTGIPGGAGGYSTATVTTGSGSQNFGVFVGQGGFYSDQNGGGGGYSGLFVGTSESAGNCIAIAGGGGGAGTYNPNCNGGGSSTPGHSYAAGAGQSSGGSQPSCGGSCSSDGSWPFGSPTFSGVQFRGGWGCGGNIRGNGGWPGGGHAGGGNGCNGAAGGAGWYGGGGGGDRGANGGDGEGGSGYVAGQTSGSSSVSGVTVTSGSSTRSGTNGEPPQTGNTYYPGSGVGYACNVSGSHGSFSGTARAGSGYVVIVY
jgi:hypothetical protein